MKATLIKDNLPYFHGHAALYRMSPPHEGNEFVIASAANALYTGQRPTFSRQMPMDWSLAGTRLKGLIEAALAMQ